MLMGSLTEGHLLMAHDIRDSALGKEQTEDDYCDTYLLFMLYVN